MAANPIDEDIRAGSFRPVYLLYGQEAYLRRQYRDRLIAALTGGDKSGGASGGMAGATGGMAGMAAGSMNFNAYEGKDINPREVIDLAETLPFFADRRVILIENSGFFKSSCEELAEYVSQVAPQTHLVFVEDEVDRRTKMYKEAKKAGCLVEFAAQDEETLYKWVRSRFKREGKEISRDALRLFLERAGGDMGNIDREMEKLACYAMDRPLIGREDVEAIVTERVEGKVFEMVDAVAGGDGKRAIGLYYDILREKKESPTAILYLITRQFRILSQLRDMEKRGIDQKSMAQRAGIPPFAVRKNLAQARGFSAGRLRRAVSDGVELEEAVKTGRMDERMAVELLLVRYSGTAGMPGE